MTVKRLAPGLAALATIGAGPAAFAAEGLPQLDPQGFVPQLVWLAITFVVLLLILSKVAMPRIDRVLEARRTRIDGDLEQAARMRSEAEAIMTSYQKALADARGEAQALQRSVAEATAKASTAAQDTVTRELAAQAREADERIATAKNAALSNVRSIAVEVAEAAVARLSGEPASRATIETAVDGVMQERR